MTIGRPPAFAANRFIAVDPEDAWLLERSWSFLFTPYTVYAVDPQRRLLHREIMQPPQGLVVDHRNGWGLDCRRRNLRVCSQSSNILRAYPGGGVYPSGSKWKVQLGGKHLGTFSIKAEAEAHRLREWERLVG